MEDALSDYMDGLYAYAMVLSRNRAMAADLVQETYVRALKAKNNVRIDTNIKSWLFTILRNIWLNNLRHDRSGPPMLELEADVQISEIAVASSGDPHDLYMKKQRHDQVRNAIQQLPVDFREIIILREYEELSYQEIATLLQCPIGTVMSRLARARSRLGALLADSWQAPPAIEEEQAG